MYLVLHASNFLHILIIFWKKIDMPKIRTAPPKRNVALTRTSTIMRGRVTR